MAETNHIEETCSSEQVPREGSSRRTRFLEALDPKNNKLDDRTAEDLLVFAEHYANLVRFYDVNEPVEWLDGIKKDAQLPNDSNEKQISQQKASAQNQDEKKTIHTWKEFFYSDIAVVIASISQYKTRLWHIKQEYDDKRDETLKNATVGNYVDLFKYIIHHADRINRWFTRSIQQHPLKSELEVMIKSSLAPALSRLVSYDKGSDPVSPPDLGISKLYNDFSNEPWSIDFKNIQDDHSIYTGKSKEEKIQHAVLYVDDIFHEFYKAYEQLTGRSDYYFQQATENYPDHQPHMALFIAFVELFSYAQTELNTLTERHLEFYYRDVLHLKEKPASPDSVYLIYELAKNFLEYDLKQGTSFTAGKDGIGKELLYNTDKDLVINQAKVKELKTIFIDKMMGDCADESTATIAKIYAAPIANSADGLGTKFKDPETAWPTFGYFETGDPNKTIVGKESEIGFAIASPQLFLAEGLRTIKFTLSTSPFEFDQSWDGTLSLKFDIYLTGEKGWILFSDQDASCDVSSGNSTDLHFEDLSLLPTDPAVMAFNEKIHAGSFSTKNPVAKFILKNNSQAIEGVELRPYDFLKKITVNSIQINVTVGSADPPSTGSSIPSFSSEPNFDGLTRSLLLENDNGLIDPKKPFYPFTPSPKVGSTFKIECDEAFSKNLLELRLDVEWLGLPDENFSGYYQLYTKPDSTIEQQVIGTKSASQLPQREITGTIRDERGNLVIGATISVQGTAIGATSDANGNYNLTSVPPGIQILLVNYLGYKPKEITVKSTERIDIQLNLAIAKIINSNQDFKILSSLKLSSQKFESGEIPLFEDDANDPNDPKSPASANRLNIDNIKGPYKIWRANGFDFFADREKPSLILELEPPGFLSEMFQKIIFEQALKGKEGKAVNLPFAPQVKSLFLNYYSEHAFSSGIDQFFHLFPFGEAEIFCDKFYDDKPELDKPKFEKLQDLETATENLIIPTQYLLPQLKFGSDEPTRKRIEDLNKDAAAKYPQFKQADYFFLNQYESLSIQQGLLFIGIENLIPPQNLSLLFKFADGTAYDNDSEPPKINWSYLVKNEWRPLPPDHIVSDSTYGFQTTGITLIDFPADVAKNNGIISSDLHWLCASVNYHADRVPKLIDVIAQANSTTFSDQQNDPQHYSIPLPAKSIAKPAVKIAEVKSVLQPFESFDGKMREEGTTFYTRASERLRHKAHAVTPWDYEHLVLEEFPSIYKVKCLTHIDPECICRDYSEIDPADDTKFITKCCCKQVAPGHVLIVPVSNLRNKNAIDRLKPRTPRRVLIRIEEYLKKRTSPFVHVHVKNPTFEEIRVSFDVKFNSGIDKGYYLKKLNEDIVQYLTPWAFESDAEVHFGNTIYASQIINFIEELEYVDYITCFRMIHIATGCCPEDNLPALTCPEIRIDLNSITDESLKKEKSDRFLTEVTAFSPQAILVSAKQHCIEVIDETPEEDPCECNQ